MWDTITRFAGDVFGGAKEKPAVTKRKDEIEKVMGVRPNIIDPTDNPITDAIHTGYTELIGRPDRPALAFDALNAMIMPNYKPGQKPAVEVHETGHLSNEQAGLPKHLGAAGRFVGRAISDNIGNPAPLDLVSGVLMVTQDAEEEDRAERLTKKYGAELGVPSDRIPYIYDNGTSAYGNNIRKEGMSRVFSAIDPIVAPIRTVNRWNTQRKQAGLQPQIRDAVLNHRRLNEASDDITPELIESTKNLLKLKEKYGDGYLDFINTIK